VIVVLVTIVVFGVVFALVTWRRRVTARWQPDLTRHVVESDGPWCTNVWLQKEPPRRSRRGGNDRVKGEVCVDVAGRVATSRVRDGQAVQLSNVRAVTVGASGSDFVNTWVEARCDVNGQAMVVYLNDARWLGWHPLLTNANTRLADALASLLPG